MINIIIKTLVLYLLIIFAMRLMGKKLAGQLQPYEFVITLLIAEVASTPMDSPGTPIIYGLVPAVTLLLLYYLFTFLTLKSRRVRLLLCGKPSILIQHGKIDMDELRKMNYSLNDLLEQLRISGYSAISDIHYAVLETNGQLSVLPYSENAPVTPRDMGLEVAEDNLNFALVLDGQMHLYGLEQFGITKEYVSKLLHTLGFNDYRKVLVFTLSDTGDVFIQDKQNNTKNLTLKNFQIDRRSA